MLNFTDYPNNLTYDSNSLDLSNHSLNDHPELMQSLSNFLKVNTTIKILNLSNNNLGLRSENLKILYEGLKNNTTIEEIDLSSNNLGINQEDLDNGVVGLTVDDEMQRMIDIFFWICESIDDCNSLKKLNLDNNLKMGSNWINIVKRKLDENMNIENLNFDSDSTRTSSDQEDEVSIV